MENASRKSRPKSHRKCLAPVKASYAAACQAKEQGRADWGNQGILADSSNTGVVYKIHRSPAKGDAGYH